MKECIEKGRRLESVPQVGYCKRINGCAIKYQSKQIDERKFNTLLYGALMSVGYG